MRPEGRINYRFIEIESESNCFSRIPTEISFKNRFQLFLVWELFLVWSRFRATSFPEPFPWLGGGEKALGTRLAFENLRGLNCQFDIFSRVRTLHSFFQKFRSFLIQETVNALLLVFSEILFIHLFLNVISKLRRNEETLDFCRQHQTTAH